MINTGLLLAKPHQSDYSKFRTLLIANSGCMREKSIMSSALKELVTDLECKYDSAYSPPLTQIALAYQQAANHPNLARLDFEKTKSIKLKITRNCPECAKIGYHTDLFEFLWVANCPVHKRPLTEICDGCGGSWPTMNQLFNNTCLSCGIDIPIKILHERNAFNKKPYVEIKKLKKLFKPLKKSQGLWYEFIFQRSIYDRPTINTLSAFQPTAVKIHSNKNTNHGRIFRTAKLPRHKHFCIKFSASRVQKMTANSYYVEKDIKIKTIKKLLRKTHDTISEVNKSNHPPGYCSRLKTDYALYCGSCKALYLFRSILLKELNSLLYRVSTEQLNTPMIPYVFANQLKELTASDNLIRFPRMVTTLNVFDKKNTLDQSIYLNKNIQALLLHIDLWTLFLRIYTSFVYLEKSLKKGPKCLIELRSECPPIVRTSSEYFCPYYIHKDNDCFILTLPKVFLNHKLRFTKNSGFLAI